MPNPTFTPEELDQKRREVAERARRYRERKRGEIADANAKERG